MHDVAIPGISAQYIGYDLAKRIGEEALVNVPDGLVHIFFGGRYPSLVVP
jgi:hypothetical protein